MILDKIIPFHELLFIGNTINLFFHHETTTISWTKLSGQLPLDNFSE
jgi:hypothetical protein